MGLRLTLPQRCLLFLLDRGDLREDDPAAQEVTQDRIAEAIAAQRAHVSRAMGKLAAQGLLRTAKVHVRREPRRRLAYFLTEDGMRRAQAIRKQVEEERVLVTDLQGNEAERRLYEIALLLPRRPRLSDLLATVEGGRLDLRTFLDRQARMKAGKVYDVPEALLPAYFQGRSAELDVLQGFLADPTARGLVMVGLPGIGKTALASRWVSGLKGRLHVLWRRLRPETSASDVLRDIATLLEGAGRPALSEILRRPPEGGDDLPRLVLERDLAAVSVLLVFDDAHAANREVAILLGDLLQPIDAPSAAHKILFLSRERAGFVRADDLAKGRVRELELSDLPGPDARAVLEALGAPASRWQEIMDRCGGHPLSLELAGAGRFTVERARETSATWFAEEALSRLATEPRRALELAGVFEGTIPPEALGPHARELLRRCLIREVEGGKTQVHDLIREAALQGVPPKRLAALRVRAGRILSASRDPADTISAIRLFLLGKAPDLAEELAGERGVAIIDAGLSQALVPLVDPGVWTKAGRTLPPRMWLLRGEALFALGRWADAGAAYRACRPARDPSTSAQARLGEAKAEQRRETLHALPLLLDARDRLEKIGALHLLAEAQYQLGCVYETRLQFDLSEDAFERGRAVAFDVGDRRWEGLCTYGLGRLRSLRWDNVGAVEIERDALRLLERGGYRLDVAKVCGGLGGNLLELQQWDEAEAYLTRATADARATGAIAVVGVCLYNLASIRERRGDFDAVIPLALEAMELDEIVEHFGPAAWAAALVALAYWTRGDEEEGDRYARIGEEHLKRAREPAQRMRALRHLARAARLAKRFAQSRDYLNQAIAEARTANLPGKVEEVTTDLRALPSP
ncbi:MAG: hypothetical protein E6K16_03945 [Methanobacteriota archaeon]|nr:MAG: hypothetical protein E6K16_03945 [Euryarchaeota archaeon]